VGSAEMVATNARLPFERKRFLSAVVVPRLRGMTNLHQFQARLAQSSAVDERSR